MSSQPPLQFFFVVNDNSGRDELDDTLDAITSAMCKANRNVDVYVLDEIASIDNTIQKAVDAAKAQHGAVVAVGGDGTINAVAAAALASGCLFGAIPRGTFNYFGRTHQIPEEINAALEDLIQGVPRPVQVGWVNDRVFLVNASVGLYPELLEDREQFKRRYGRSRLVALWSAVITAFREHRHFDMVLEEGENQVRLRAATLFVGNNRLQLEQVGMPQAALLNQKKLAAIAVNPVSTLELLGLAARGAVGRLADAENVTGFSFRNLTVSPIGLWRGMRNAWQVRRVGGKRGEGKQVIKVAIDGEITWLQPPLNFRVGTEPLMLIKPERDSPVEDTAGDLTETLAK